MCNSCNDDPVDSDELKVLEAIAGDTMNEKIALEKLARERVIKQKIHKKLDKYNLNGIVDLRDNPFFKGFDVEIKRKYVEVKDIGNLYSEFNTESIKVSARGDGEEPCLSLLIKMDYDTL